MKMRRSPLVGPLVGALRIVQRAAPALAIGAMVLTSWPCAAQAPTPFVPDDDNDRRLEMRTHVHRFVEALNGDLMILQESMFTEEALEAVSLDDVRLQIEQMHRRSGGFQFLGQNVIDDTHIRAWIRGNAGEFLDVDLDLIIQVEREFPFAVEDIQLAPTTRLGPRLFENWAQFGAAVDDMGQDIAIVVHEILPGDDTPRVLFERHPNRAMAIGPAASLIQMRELLDQIRAGDTSWPLEVTLEQNLKSLPSSFLATQPPGQLVSVAELAKRMMVFADNSAFDHMVELLGREKLSARMATSAGLESEGNARSLTPFLRTLELFQIKCQADTTMQNRFAEANPEERWRLLEEEVADLRVVMELFSSWEAPRGPGQVGWTSNATSLAGVMGDLWRARLEDEMGALGEIMAAPDRIPWDRRVWQEFWLEINGEPGAMASVWAMQRRDGREFVVAMIANSDRESLTQIFSNDTLLGAIELLEHLP